jgi:hypothetical protein
VARRIGLCEHEKATHSLGTILRDVLQLPPLIRKITARTDVSLLTKPGKTVLGA